MDEKESILCVLKLKSIKHTQCDGNKQSTNIFPQTAISPEQKYYFVLFLILSRIRPAHQLCGFVLQHGQWPLEEQSKSTGMQQTS